MDARDKHGLTAADMACIIGCDKGYRAVQAGAGAAGAKLHSMKFGAG
jgi:hypothetical protein